MINKDDFISIEENIQKKIIKERQEDYGDYEENFALLAEMFSIILFDKIRVKIEIIAKIPTLPKINSESFVSFHFHCIQSKEKKLN